MPEDGMNWGVPTPGRLDARPGGKRLLIAFAHGLRMKSKAFMQGEDQPKVDYLELARKLRVDDGWAVDMVDPSMVDHSPSAWLRGVGRLAGPTRAIALFALLNSSRYDMILSLGDSLAVMIAMGHRLVPKHCPHVTTFLSPVSAKKLRLQRYTSFTKEIDLTLIHTEGEMRRCLANYGGSPECFGLVPLQVDHDWYRPSPNASPVPTVCAVGVEFRDYATLVEAARYLPDFRFLLNPQSPWSAKSAGIRPEDLPPNCEIRLIENGTIRNLYDEASIIAVPLHDNDGAAGLTAILQGMSMAKPVVVTRTSGRSSMLCDGQNCMLMAPGDVGGWISGLAALRDDPAMASRLGQQGRRWVEANATIADWVESMRAFLLSVTTRCSAGMTPVRAHDADP